MSEQIEAYSFSYSRPAAERLEQTSYVKPARFAGKGGLGIRRAGADTVDYVHREINALWIKVIYGMILLLE
jgi:hypothetical protein